MSPWYSSPEEAFALGGKSGMGFTWQEDQALRNHFGAAPTSSGIAVSSRSAFRIATAARAIRVISEGVAQLPLELWDREQRTRKRATAHPLHRVLTRRPNPWHTRMGFLEMLTMHAVLTGNGFAWINRVDGQIVELLPIPPGCCQIVLWPRGERTYRVVWHDGTSGEYEQSDIFHLAGPSVNGIDGIDLVHEMREILGLTQAITKQASRFHERDRRPPGILSVDKSLTPDGRARIKEAWEKAYGPDGTGGLAVLDLGFKFDAISSTGKDSESLDMLKFQVEEICRIFSVFPQMVMSSAGSGSYSTIEQLFLAHLAYTIDPWLIRWEETIGRDLLTESDHAAGVYARFTRTSINRVALDAKKSYYQGALGTASSAGWMTVNEVREIEEMDPLDGYDEPFFPRQAVPGPSGGAANLAKNPPVATGDSAARSRPPVALSLAHSSE